MIRLIALATISLAVLAVTTDNAEARNFFFRQGGPSGVEPLPVPAAPSQQRWFAPLQKGQYQAVQKMPYQAIQKSSYHTSTVATCVRYVQHCPHRRSCCDCGSSYQTVLTVVDPKTCCTINVPVCLPSCCTGQPMSSGRHGLLVRGVTNYSWCCGYRVRIVLGHHGAVTVHYYGV